MNKLLIFSVIAVLVSFLIAGGNGDGHAEILKLDSQIDGKGNYKYQYEISNGIKGEEEGVGGQQAKGSFSFTSPENEQFEITYVADANGFHPSGKHLPTPPPIPDYIAKYHPSGKQLPTLPRKSLESQRNQEEEYHPEY
ncbi:pupal cuticle protein Edg-78E-like [Haematobia irritans]|uniref:pupal cuticle protein Edg-78E-like n=1 Tax=Haematobia irritans TaxID=7368 RepID=UPI003F4F92B9